MFYQVIIPPLLITVLRYLVTFLIRFSEQIKNNISMTYELDQFWCHEILYTIIHWSVLSQKNSLSLENWYIHSPWHCYCVILPFLNDLSVVSIRISNRYLSDIADNETNCEQNVLAYILKVNNLKKNSATWCCDVIISGNISQYHVCWCPGSLRRSLSHRDINSIGTD